MSQPVTETSESASEATQEGTTPAEQTAPARTSPEQERMSEPETPSSQQRRRASDQQVKCPDCRQYFDQEDIGVHRFQAHGEDRRAKEEPSTAPPPPERRTSKEPPKPSSSEGTTQRKRPSWWDRPERRS
jgi:hypothetical protein